MIIYRVSYYIDAGRSAGFGWFLTMKEAKAAAREWHKHAPEEQYPRIHDFKIPVTREGFTQFLARYASHPDNG